MGKGGIAHKTLIERGRGILKRMGYDDYSIYQEYPIAGTKDLPFRCVVDIVGLSQNKKVAIECGTLNSSVIYRFSELRSVFDKVIWLPYLTTDTTDFDSEGIMTLSEMKEQLDRDMDNDPIHKLYIQSGIKAKESEAEEE